MGPCEVSGVLWALASLGYYPPPHLAAGLAGCLLQEQLDRANGLDLANGLWALGVLGWPVRQRQLRAAWQRMQVRGAAGRGCGAGKGHGEDEEKGPRRSVGCTPVLETGTGVGGSDGMETCIV